MFNEAATIISRLQIGFVIQAVDDPHLVARTTRCDIVSLFENLFPAFLPHWMWWRFGWGIHNGQKHDIALIALELCRVAAKNLRRLIFRQFDSMAQDGINFQGLLITNQ